MFALIIQTILLMAIAFILGCVLGCLLRQLFGSANAEAPVARGSAGTTAAVGATGAAIAAGAATVAAKGSRDGERRSLDTPAAPAAPAGMASASGSGAARTPAAPITPTPPIPPAAPAAPKEPAAVAPKPQSLMGNAGSAGGASTGGGTAGGGSAASGAAAAAGAGALAAGAAASARSSGTTAKAAPKKTAPKKPGSSTSGARAGATTSTAAGASPATGAAKPAAAKPVSAKSGTASARTRATSAAGSAKGTAKRTTATKAAGKTSGTRSRATAKPAAAAATGAPDNLKLIRGIGPQNEGRLNNLGVSRFDQIAKWSKKDQAHYGEVLAFPGRIEREDWVGQAKKLAKGQSTDFSKRVKSGTVASSMGVASAGLMGTKPTNLLSEPRGGKGDNLTLIDGVGNAIEKKMFKMGIYHFDQIAKMSKAEIAWLGTAVGFPGRPERENWQGESKTLAAGGTTEHAKRVERGEIKTSRKT